MRSSGLRGVRRSSQHQGARRPLPTRRCLGRPAGPHLSRRAGSRPPSSASPQEPVSSWPAIPRRTLATLAAVALSGYLPRCNVVETLSRSLMTSSKMTVRSSGDVRFLAATDADIDGVGSRTRNDSACAPRLPSTTPNSTRVPPLSVATPSGNASACRNTSAPWSSLRKPKPFSASYHLTLPIGTAHLLLICRPLPDLRARRESARCADPQG